MIIGQFTQVKTNKTQYHLPKIALKIANDIRNICDSSSIYHDNIACFKGCSFCCHQIVTISIFEAVLLAESLVDVDDNEIDRLQTVSGEKVKINNRIKES